jgi:hypothetical protein
MIILTLIAIKLTIFAISFKRIRYRLRFFMGKNLSRRTLREGKAYNLSGLTGVLFLHYR